MDIFNLKNINVFWEFLNTPNDNPKIEKANREIKELIPIFSFICASLSFMIITMNGENITNKQGSGFVFFALTVTVILLVFVTLHIKKKSKRRFQVAPNQAEKHQQVHG